MSDFEHIDLKRQFTPFTPNQNDPTLYDWDWLESGKSIGGVIGWDELLQQDKVVILAEAGTGKTEELKAITKILNDKREVAFFGRLEQLLEFDFDAYTDWELGSTEKFYEWVGSSDKTAYFFLDSVDEAKLESPNALEKALKRFVKVVGVTNLTRAKVFLTSRISEWRANTDLNTFYRVLQLQPEDKFGQGNETRKYQVVYKLEPLSEEQIRIFASTKQVAEPQAFLDAIKRADAEIFASRPQDLLDLIAYWQEHNKLGQHIEVLSYNIEQKLRERKVNKDTLLSFDQAYEGALLLAAAATLTKKNKICVPDDNIDVDVRIASIDPTKVLTSWDSPKIAALLTRPIFDQAIYGAVRFHHRSVREFLTAKWLYRLIEQGGSRRSIEGLLFASTYGREVAIPSMQPMAAWLAVWDERIRSRLLKVAPEVLLEYGDPPQFTIEFRVQLLDAVIAQYEGQHHTDLVIDPALMRRTAHEDMADAINVRLQQYAYHEDLSNLLLKLVWHGDIKSSMSIVTELALTSNLELRLRQNALSTVLDLGTEQEKRLAISRLLCQNRLGREVLVKELGNIFPNYLTLSDFCLFLRERVKVKDFDIIYYHLDKISKSSLDDLMTLQLIEQMLVLVDEPPYFEKYTGKWLISENYGWLCGSVLPFINKILINRSHLSFSDLVLKAFYTYFIYDKGFNYYQKAENKKLLNIARSWGDFAYRAFWYVNSQKAFHRGGFYSWHDIAYYTKDLWSPRIEDWERLIDELEQAPDLAEKRVILSALWFIYKNSEDIKLLDILRLVVQSDSDLQQILEFWINPPPLSEKELEQQRKELESEQEHLQYMKEQDEIRLDWKNHIQANPKALIAIGEPTKGVIYQEGGYIYNWVDRKPKSITTKGLPVSVLSDIESEFGKSVADGFKQGCIQYWRDYDPLAYVDVRLETPYAPEIGLTGLAFEFALYPNNISNLSSSEARRAATYAIFEYSFPNWFYQLQTHYPLIVTEVLLARAQYELSSNFNSAYSEHLLAKMCRFEALNHKIIAHGLLALLNQESCTSLQNTESALQIILKEPVSNAVREQLSTLALSKFSSTTQYNAKFLWLKVLFAIKANWGYRVLISWLAQVPCFDNKVDIAVRFFAELHNDRENFISLANQDYLNISILEKLVPLAYDLIRFEDDTRHDDLKVYHPNRRDYAQRTRAYLLEYLAKIKSQKSYSLLLKWSGESTHFSYKDWLLRLAKARAESDSELESWKKQGIIQFTNTYEKQPSNEKQLFEVAVNRILDLKDDLERGDKSIAQTLQRIDQETELRNLLAYEFEKGAKGKYTIAQEEEMADKKRTDIRFLLSGINPVPVELKIADKWSFGSFAERLENQLIKQYMRISRYSVFLLIYRGDKKYWQDESRKEYSFFELVGFLEIHAIALKEQYTNISDLKIIGIDLTARASS